MIWFRAVTALALATGAQAASSIQPMPSSNAAEVIVARDDKFRQGLAELHRKYSVPGIAAAVFSTRGLEAAEAFGVRRSRDPLPIELADRFYIASIAKPMTATLAATIVDQGLIQWTTTVAEVWPSRRSAMHPQIRGVTLAQLLSHKAGIPAFTQDEDIASAPQFSGSPREQRAAFAQWMLARPPEGEAGAHSYSNAGFGIAAAMLEEVTDKSWEQLMRERVFEPLSMSSCGVGWPSSAGDQPHGHRLIDGSYVNPSEGAPAPLPASIAPGGDIHCNVVDLGRFGEAHMLGLLGRHSLLRPETFQTMHRKTGDYALGWNTPAFGSTHLGGVTEGWHASLIVSPDAQLVVAVVINAREPGRTDELFTEASQLAFDLFRKPAQKP